MNIVENVVQISRIPYHIYNACNAHPICSIGAIFQLDLLAAVKRLICNRLNYQLWL